MTDDTGRVRALFTRADGSFRFSRWGRPLAPMIYGTDDAGVRLFERSLGSVAELAGLEIVEVDPDLAANFIVYFVKDWGELTGIPHLVKLIPGIAKLVTRLAVAGATQYRIFGFDDDGAVCICITMIRYGSEMKRVSAQTLAVTQSFLGILLWTEGAFADESPVALTGEDRRCVVKPWHAALIRAAYDPAIPPAGIDSSLALRLAARLAVMQASPVEEPAEAPREDSP
ncbi:MAG TPA: hypothetical protein VLA52_00910 [Thermohalobaculum sp.]|nr:hypothetical protein [Thermohalobaculum sp.]